MTSSLLIDSDHAPAKKGGQPSSPCRRPVTAAEPAVDLAAAQAAAHDLLVALGADLADVGVRDTWSGGRAPTRSC